MGVNALFAIEKAKSCLIFWFQFQSYICMCQCMCMLFNFSWWIRLSGYAIQHE